MHWETVKSKIYDPVVKALRQFHSVVRQLEPEDLVTLKTLALDDCGEPLTNYLYDVVYKEGVRRLEKVKVESQKKISELERKLTPPQ